MCSDVCAGGEAPSSEQGAKNTAPTDQQAADDTDKDNDGFPDGSHDLLMIGDSVSLRAVDTFDGVFPHSHIDAEKAASLMRGARHLRAISSRTLPARSWSLPPAPTAVTDDQIDIISRCRR